MHICKISQIGQYTKKLLLVKLCQKLSQPCILTDVAVEAQAAGYANEFCQVETCPLAIRVGMIQFLVNHNSTFF